MSTVYIMTVDLLTVDILMASLIGTLYIIRKSLNVHLTLVLTQYNPSLVATYKNVLC